MEIIIMGNLYFKCKIDREQTTSKLAAWDFIATVNRSLETKVDGTAIFPRISQDTFYIKLSMPDNIVSRSGSMHSETRQAFQDIFNDLKENKSFRVIAHENKTVISEMFDRAQKQEKIPVLPQILEEEMGNTDSESSSPDHLSSADIKKDLIEIKSAETEANQDEGLTPPKLT